MSQPPTSNRLADARSPYLRQHASNPVHWMPWGGEAFALARATGRPIFLSIGYSTCHWCHVMAHESFEDATVATLLNTLFVPVKVDREERPDVDRLYMAFVQATTGHGGWPMSVWLTPDLKPFHGGTYFPLEGSQGRPGFIEILRRVATVWAQERAHVETQAERLVQHLRETALPPGNPDEPDPSEEDLATAVAAFAEQFDRDHGGFGAGPKFPRPAALRFLAHAAARFPELSQWRDTAVEMLSLTLRRMAAGGLRDHLGGGFHRYAVDDVWHVPHFEKMLYDQAQLACAYADGFLLTREPAFVEVLRSTLAYVERDLAHPEGGFCGAEDADSLRQAGDREPVEGAFYVWTAEEVARELDPEFAPVFEYAYGVLPQGNCAPASDPHGELTGRNVLFERHTLEATAARFSLGASEVARQLADARRRLLAARARRIRPSRDDKVIAGWNGLMVSGFSRAAQALSDPAYARSATRTAAALRQRLWNPATRTLCRLPRLPGEADRAGFAEDYAFVIQGLLDLYETTFEHTWLAWAVELQERMDELFFDEANGGYFSGPAGDPSLLLRLKEDYDGAEPAASSVAALNLIRLHEILHTPALRLRAAQTVRAFAPQWRAMPTSLPALLAAADFLVGPVRQVMFLGDPEDPRLAALVRTAHSVFGARRTLVLCDGGPGQRWLADRQPIYAGLAAPDGIPAAQVCEGFTCQLPVTLPMQLRTLLTRGG